MIIFFIGLFVGLLLLFLGWRIRYKQDYGLIVGVNELSQEDRERMDMAAIAREVGTVLFVSGGGWVAAGALNWAGVAWAFYAWVLVFVIMVIALVFRIEKRNAKQRGDGTKGRRRAFAAAGLSMVLTLAVLGVVGVMLFRNTTEPTITTAGDTLRIEALFGTEVAKQAINDVRWIDGIPSGTRTNGGSFMGSLRGSFSLDHLGACKVYAKSGVSPYILIGLGEDEGGYIILGMETIEQTREVYRVLADWLADAPAAQVAPIDSTPSSLPFMP